MSRDEEIEPRWSFRTGPIRGLTVRESRRGWDAVAEWWASRYGPRGDVNREWVIDPALFRLLGDVRGRRVLDAGCGTGYLARLLAARGATVVGVDLSPKLLAVARDEETRAPLGIEYREGDLARLPGLADASFDLIVSNVVVQDVLRYREAFRELHRVLRPGGRFVFSVTHPCFERPMPGVWVREPPDSERVEEWRGLLVDRYYDRLAIRWGPSGRETAVSFHRTLEDYVASLHDAGFVIGRLEEPMPSAEALRKAYRHFADYGRVPNFMIVEAIRSVA